MKKNQFNITVCENPKFIWFRNAKVATRSIKWVINQQFDTHEFYKKGIKPYDLSEYFTFGFVRNPYSRILSGYFNKMVRFMEMEKSELQKKHYKYLQYIPNYDKISFQEGFKILLYSLKTPGSVLFQNPHFTLQSHLINPNKLDYLGRFENLQEDTKLVFKKIGAQFILPHMNKSKRLQFDPSEFLDQENQNIIKELYQKDFEIFNYPFNV